MGRRKSMQEVRARKLQEIFRCNRDEFLKRLADLYSGWAADAARCARRVGGMKSYEVLVTPITRQIEAFTDEQVREEAAKYFLPMVDADAARIYAESANRCLYFDNLRAWWERRYTMSNSRHPSD